VKQQRYTEEERISDRPIEFIKLQFILIDIIRVDSAFKNSSIYSYLRYFNA